VAASYGTGWCCCSDYKGQRQAANSRESKRQRLLLLLRRPCPSPGQKARFFKLFSFFLCSLRIGLLDVNGSE
jgi:hypothetical protein